MNSQRLLIPPKFLENAESLSKDTKNKLIRIMGLLSRDFRHPGLQAKKVQGSRAEVFECRVDKGIRLVYDHVPGAIRCWYVGAHDVALRVAESLGSGGIQVDDIEIIQHEDCCATVERYLLTGLEPAFSELDLDRLRM